MAFHLLIYRLSSSLDAVSSPVCGDTVMMRVEIDEISAQQLINDSLLVYLPREYAFYPGSARANDRQIADPSIVYKGDFQILSWVNKVRFSNDQPFTIEFLLHGTCGDICGRGEGRAILMSRVQASCNDLSCVRYLSRAATPWELLFWRPIMELVITNFEVLSIHDTIMRALVSWDLS
ncbi:MAG: hypothetical protein ACJA01_003573 [Saprospiraceae bacterium]